MGSGAVVVRCLLLGAAAGSRSSLGVAAPVLTARTPEDGTRSRTTRSGQVLALLGVLGELVGDKLPRTPSRLDPPGPVLRAGSGASGGVLLARRAHASPYLPALAGVAGALAGIYGGAAWRAWADARTADWKPAVAEDVVAVGLACLAVRT
ncbi:hypothetical protein ACGIF2_16795 [Cellulomonas sp. P22]|uniref:hypothetical protein n=1 Tax=Cellulomonas sp. P22 TaxID=3373189 RepID=UPI0037A3E2A0